MFEEALNRRAKETLNAITAVVSLDGFYMAGGTGLALQMGHRISEDLDFFKTTSFDPGALLSDLRGQVSLIKDVSITRDTLLCLIKEVKCSFFSYNVPLLFAELDYMDCKIADWRDIIAEKIKTISQRGSKKDFYDVYYAIISNRLSIQETVTLFRKRFESTHLNFYHVLRSLAYFEDADEEPDPVLTEGQIFKWKEVKSFYVGKIRDFERHFMEPIDDTRGPRG